jgi:hypothetical protein
MSIVIRMGSDSNLGGFTCYVERKKPLYTATQARNQPRLRWGEGFGVRSTRTLKSILLLITFNVQLITFN